jgi:peptidoglycan/xylan/chitin deacetylase (PgdA/CDA1 family)
VHGYTHENPIAMTPDQEEAILVKCIDVLGKLSGKKPRGYIAPWWELSAATAGLLLKYGFVYDHSMFHDDFTPYYVRVGDSWTVIDYSQHPSTWMKPLKRGTVTPLIEIPASWYLDDLPPMMFIKKAPNSHGFVNPRDIEELWRDQFDWVYREMDYAVFPIAIHPDVAGRPQVLLMLERLYAYMIKHPGVRFLTLGEMADDFARRQVVSGCPPGSGRDQERPHQVKLPLHRQRPVMLDGTRRHALLQVVDGIECQAPVLEIERRSQDLRDGLVPERARQPRDRCHGNRTTPALTPAADVVPGRPRIRRSGPGLSIQPAAGATS